LEYLENVHRLREAIDQKLLLFKVQFEIEANEIERKLKDESKRKLIKENEKKQKEKYLNDILYLFYPRNIH